MAELVSIIVPIYNTAAYIPKCVESVLKQTYPHFELLLIDDGSQDGSRAICEAMCSTDSRIHLLPREHGGVSPARNAGIEAAKGEYLFFLDSDDTMHPRLLEALCELTEATGASLATEVYRHVDADSSHSFLDSLDASSDKVWEYSYMDNAEAIRQFSSRKNGYNFHGIGGKLVRRSVVGSLRFNEELGNGEDTLFVYQLLERGPSAVILWEEWYYYRKYENSSSGRLTVQSCQDMFYCLDYICGREQAREGAANAAFWALFISARLRRMYVRSRKSHNREVSAYLKKLAMGECRSWRFSLLTSSEKRKHYLAFLCYPLYLPIHKLSTWQWQRREKKQEKK